MPLTPSERRAMELAEKALRKLPGWKRLQALRAMFGFMVPRGKKPSASTPKLSRVRSPRATDLGAVIGQITRKDSRALARDLISLSRGHGTSSLLRTVFSQLGTAGKVAESLVQAKDISSPSIPKSAIEDAIALLQGAGFEVRMPGKSSPTATPGRLPAFDRPSLRTGQPNTGQPNTGAPSRPRTGAPGEPPGRSAPQAPLQGPQPETGAFPGGLYVPMERVTSSNVYAIGYNGATQTMRVQYLGTALNASGISGAGHSGRKRVRGAKGKTLTGKRYGAGPTYDYFGVPERVFNKIKNASSKGKAIWDNLRIRGTVYGHKFDYRLTAASVADVIDLKSGRRVAKVTYVPRKATGPGGFEARTMLQGVGPAAREYRSLLRSTRGRRQ